MGEWIDKSWGRCRTLLANDYIEIVEAEIRAGGSSSRHYHTCKSNEFIVVSGYLLVHEYWTHHLTPDVSPLVLAAGKTHQFEAKTDVKLIEIYRANGGRLRHGEGDIVRLEEAACGG